MVAYALACSCYKALNLFFRVRTKKQPIFFWAQLSLAMKRKLGRGGGRQCQRLCVSAPNSYRFLFFFVSVSVRVLACQPRSCFIACFCTRIAVEGAEPRSPSMQAYSDLFLKASPVFKRKPTL